jgi:hypothetical protein
MFQDNGHNSNSTDLTLLGMSHNALTLNLPELPLLINISQHAQSALLLFLVLLFLVNLHFRIRLKNNLLMFKSKDSHSNSNSNNDIIPGLIRPVYIHISMLNSDGLRIYASTPVQAQT